MNFDYAKICLPLKFDNFVMDEISDHGESDDAEDFISGGYQASFCPESSSESAIEGTDLKGQLSLDLIGTMELVKTIFTLVLKI